MLTLIVIGAAIKIAALRSPRHLRLRAARAGVEARLALAAIRFSAAIAPGDAVPATAFLVARTGTPTAGAPALTACVGRAAARAERGARRRVLADRPRLLPSPQRDPEEETAHALDELPPRARAVHRARHRIEHPAVHHDLLLSPRSPARRWLLDRLRTQARAMTNARFGCPGAIDDVQARTYHKFAKPGRHDVVRQLALHTMRALGADHGVALADALR
jgi:hypothetical protein